jgi:hypothetical protein
MCFVPKRIRPARNNVFWLSARPNRPHAFEKTAWHNFGDLWPWKVGQRSIQGQRHYRRWIGSPRHSWVCTRNHLPTSNHYCVIRLWIWHGKPIFWGAILVVLGLKYPKFVLHVFRKPQGFVFARRHVFRRTARPNRPPCLNLTWKNPISGAISGVLWG